MNSENRDHRDHSGGGGTGVSVRLKGGENAVSQIQKNQGGTGSGQPEGERGGGSLAGTEEWGWGLEGGAVVSGLHPLPPPNPLKLSQENPEIGERRD